MSIRLRGMRGGEWVSSTSMPSGIFAYFSRRPSGGSMNAQSKKIGDHGVPQKRTPFSSQPESIRTRTCGPKPQLEAAPAVS